VLEDLLRVSCMLVLVILVISNSVLGDLGVKLRRFVRSRCVRDDIAFDVAYTEP